MNDIGAGASVGQRSNLQQELFPIREVSRITGVNPVTLRAWERRYGLIQPTRTDSGHRLYSQANVEEVRAILGWLERGVAVSKVGKILARTQPSSVPTSAAANPVGDSEYAQWQLQLQRAASDFDEVALERVYGQVFSLYPLSVAFQNVLLPAWQHTRQRLDTYGHTSEWLFLDQFLRARALQRLQLARSQPSEITVVLAALAGQCLELELLVAGLLLSAANVAVTVLPWTQPFEELTLVCEKIQPHALVLFSNHPPSAELPRRLMKLGFAVDCPLLLAGEASELIHDGLVGTQIACLGSEGRLMQQRLAQYLSGHLDT